MCNNALTLDMDNWEIEQLCSFMRYLNNLDIKLQHSLATYLKLNTTKIFTSIMSGVTDFGSAITQQATIDEIIIALIKTECPIKICLE